MEFNKIQKMYLNDEMINKIEKTTNLKFKQLTILIGCFFGSVIYMLMGLSILIDLVGFGYPAYKSFKSLQTKKSNDDSQWLTYWIVYSFVNLSEYILFLFSWIPLYYQFKLIFIIWLAHEHTRGAELIYKNYLENFLIKHEAKIDEAVEKIDNITDLGENFSELVTEIDELKILKEKNN